MSGSEGRGDAPRPDVWDRTWRSRSFEVDVTSRALAEATFGRGAVRGKSVLELGCGNGRLSRLALDFGARDVTLVDFSPEALRSARRVLGDDPRAEYLEADLLALDLPRRYDFVFSSGVIEHFRGNDFARAVQAHVQSSSDRLAIIVPTWPHLNSLRCRVPAIERKYGWQRPLRLSEFRGALEGGGARVESARRLLPLYGIPVLGASPVLRRASAFLDRWLGGLLVVHARVTA